jgi:hypothetical protein
MAPSEHVQQRRRRCPPICAPPTVALLFEAMRRGATIPSIPTIIVKAKFARPRQR